MQKIYVLFDSSCEFCWRCRGWMQQQAALLEIEFIAAKSPAALELFPDLSAATSCKTGEACRGDELIVVSDDGGVYRGPQAFILCLYALEEYREWSERLAHPALLPLARRAFEALSRNRGLLSAWLRHGGQPYLAERLRDPDTLPAGV